MRIATPRARPAATTLPVRKMRPASNVWRDAARRFSKNKMAVGAFMVMVLLILIGIFANVIAPAPYDYSVLTEANQFPNAKHWLGTDTVGRDFLSRLIYGIRISLIVGLSVQAIAVVIGVPLGTIAGMAGGWGDACFIRGGGGGGGRPVW